ncbi:hypothetical protein TWF281_005171 [Arthrobotrys megalospora]
MNILFWFYLVVLGVAVPSNIRLASLGQLNDLDARQPSRIVPRQSGPGQGCIRPSDGGKGCIDGYECRLDPEGFLGDYCQRVRATTTTTSPPTSTSVPPEPSSTSQPPPPPSPSPSPDPQPTNPLTGLLSQLAAAFAQLFSSFIP